MDAQTYFSAVITANTLLYTLALKDAEFSFSSALVHTFDKSVKVSEKSTLLFYKELWKLKKTRLSIDTMKYLKRIGMREAMAIYRSNKRWLKEEEEKNLEEPITWTLDVLGKSVSDGNIVFEATDSLAGSIIYRSLRGELRMAGHPFSYGDEGPLKLRSQYAPNVLYIFTVDEFIVVYEDGTEPPADLRSHTIEAIKLSGYPDNTIAFLVECIESYIPVVVKSKVESNSCFF